MKNFLNKAEPVSSRNNAYQFLEAIKRNRTKRAKAGEIAIEGVLPIDLCLKNRIPVSRVYFSADKDLSDWAKGVIIGASQARLFAVSDPLMRELSDKDAPSELILVAKQPAHDLHAIPLNRLVVVDRPSNPGNFGAIARTCDGFGIDAILISGHGIDPFDPKSITASRGTVLGIPVLKLESNSDLESLLARARSSPGFTVYGSSAARGEDLRTVQLSSRFAVIVGNEMSGMTRYLEETADIMLRIPIRGDSTSLNVACAASILLYELTR